MLYMNAMCWGNSRCPRTPELPIKTPSCEARVPPAESGTGDLEDEEDEEDLGAGGQILECQGPAGEEFHPPERAPVRLPFYIPTSNLITYVNRI
jgi:hypothetical protein